MHLSSRPNATGGTRSQRTAPTSDVTQQLRMAQDISTSVRMLLRNDAHRDFAVTALENLRRITGIHRLALFRIKPDADDRVKRIWRFQTDGGHAAAEGWESYRPDRETCARLISGEVVRVQLPTRGPGGKLSGDPQDAGSWLVFPIQVLGEWWGGLCLPEGHFDLGEEEPLFEAFATAVDLLGFFFERQLASRENAESDKLAGALEMAGTVCHKLNQPMQVILGYASMVTSGDINDPEQVCEIVKMIEDETRRMGIITKNLMGITKYRSVETPDVGSMCDIDSQTAIG